MIFYKIKEKLGASSNGQNPRLKKHYSNFAKSGTDQDRVQYLTEEICRLKNEALQVPVLKAKLDVLQHQLKLEKSRCHSMVFVDELSATIAEKAGITDNHDINDEAYNQEAMFRGERSSSGVLLVPPRSHRRNMSSMTSYSNYSGQSLFSMQNNELTKSNTELDLQSTFEETNKSLLEKLKLKEMQNAKLARQLAELEQEMRDISMAVDQEQETHGNHERQDSMVTAETSFVDRSKQMDVSKTNDSQRESCLSVNDNDEQDGGNSVFSLNINFDNLTDSQDILNDLLSGSLPNLVDSSTPASSSHFSLNAKSAFDSRENVDCHNYSFPPITPDTPEFTHFTLGRVKLQAGSVLVDSDEPLTEGPADLQRNEHFYKTLRRKGSNASLLSMNKSKSAAPYKNHSRRLSKSQYYVVRDEADDFNMKPSNSSLSSSVKRHSLVSYCQNQIHKVSPRPKSTYYS